MREVKIVYKDEDVVRVLRGIITKKDTFFITVQRNDGTYHLNKKCILRIEEGNHD